MEIQQYIPTQYWVYDLETYPNVFTFSFRKVEVEGVITRRIFELSERKDEIEELVEFLKQDKLVLIGYNSVSFDYPILHYILTSEDEMNLDNLFRFVQDQLISDESEYRLWESDHLIPQIDLFLIWHYNNKARSTSLKWLEFTTRWKKVQDLPFEPGTMIPLESIDDLIDYNNNDVDFTYKFAEISKSAISFRMNLSKKLDHNVMNYSDVKIGEYSNRISYEELSGQKFRDFKNLRTFRKVFKMSEIIEPEIEFQTEYLQEFLVRLINKSFIEGQKDDIDEILTLANNTFKFAKGGLHSEDKPRIVKPEKNFILKELDVASYYPASIINSRIYPEHLTIDWFHGVENAFTKRNTVLKPKMATLEYKSKEYNDLDDEQAVIKLSLNGGAFGGLGSKYSWQYDPLQKYRITINCQLKLLMLIEALDLAGIAIHSANTDGVVIEYYKDTKPTVDKIHKEWEDKFGYILEETFYKQVIFSTVNDYIAEITNEDYSETLKLKFKGDFEVDKDYHKNNSQRIVPYAIKEYFINGTPIVDTITNHKDIFDFCIGRKSTKKYKYSMIKGDDRIDIPDKVVRYYIAANGYKMFKIDMSTEEKDVKYSAVNKGFLVTPFMDYYESSSYDIDYPYYIAECNKIIKPIERNTLLLKAYQSEQLSLF